ncbi:MAG TPA: hypothetical protein VNH65_00350 [Candidatus Acidoferrum sp.]|nr:hypothetical protein [Candidatus Acidoferrum sp.]
MVDTAGTATATGLFSLGGVVLGALLSPLTQLYLEKKRERRAGHRARKLVAGELLHSQFNLRIASENTTWPIYVQDPDSWLPNAAWLENKSSLLGTVPDDLWDEIEMTYATLEIRRDQLILAKSLSEAKLVTADEAEAFKRSSDKLGRLRRKLGAGGGWEDEMLPSKKRTQG